MPVPCRSLLWLFVVALVASPGCRGAGNGDADGEADEADDGSSVDTQDADHQEATCSAAATACSVKTVGVAYAAMARACQPFRACRKACAAEKSSCGDAAKAHARSCKEHCKGKSGKDKKACSKLCADEKKASKKACRDARKACTVSCSAAHQEPGCAAARSKFWATAPTAGATCSAASACDTAYPP